jgi:hypothetical protein
VELVFGFGGWRKLYNEELHNLYSSADITRVIKQRGKDERNMLHELIGKIRNTYTILVRKPEGKGPLDRPRHEWKIILKLILKELGYVGVDWINLA